ncbi:MAG: fibronectin type III domain-containing protein, partial [Oscillospiraceae bacterium]|nr:fibronectin type III domain-containing protein [Oscillospiraceae bacterium]MBQ8791043.1 fibronectin type III domain-containing protein [Ruminiclostridium sp.]
MKKFSKRFLSILTALAMIYTIFLSPVSEIVGFAGESVKAGAEATALGIVKIAANEIGTAERTGNNDIKYNDWYYGRYVSGADYAWCSVFIAWCAKEAGISKDVIPQSGIGIVTSYVKYYANIGRWHRIRSNGWTESKTFNDTGLADTNYVPQQGDFILIEAENYNDGPDHIGLVDYQDGEYVYYIDGNNTKYTSGRVEYSQKKLTDSTIWGYCNPDYPVSSSSPPTNTTYGKISTADDAEDMWDYLFSRIGNAYGVAALLGNLEAESALRSNNLQNSYESALGFTDSSYTVAVDNGTYTNFVHDDAGYGLAQWTYYSRKQNLLNYAKSKNVSIADMQMQLEFLVSELANSYSKVYSTLKNATSIKEASDCILTQFERPADQSDKVKNYRASLAQKYYDKFSGDIIIKDDLIVDTDYSPVTPFKAYLLNNSTVYPCYSDCSTTTGGEIWGSDECTILEVYTNGWCKVKYPISPEETKTAYTPLSNFVGNPSLKLNYYYIPQSNQTTYTRSDKATIYGEMYKDDVCYMVASDGCVQYFYPTDSYHKLAWSDFNCPTHISRWVTTSPDVNSNKLDEGETGNLYYFWYDLRHNETDALMYEVTNLFSTTATLELINPNGTSLGTCEYTNSDRNWIRYTLNTPGTYTFKVTLSGGLTGTYTTTFQVNEAECSHSYTSKVTKAATCLATGIRTYTCSACGDSYTETIAKTSHSYSSSYTVDKAATCTAEGSKSRHCTTSGCTAKTDVTAIPKTSHSYTSKVTKAATCLATGIRTYTCSACGDSYTETIAKTSHSYSSSYTVDKAATCSAEGSKSRHCTTSGCTAKTDVTAIPKTSHSYTNKVVAPTYFAQGYTRHTCSVCSYSYNNTYTDKKILSAVSGFTSPSKSTTAIRLSWTKNSNASGYIVEQFNGSSWEQIATITDKATVTYKVTGLTPGTAYKFRVKAYVSSSSSKAYSKYTSTLTANTMMTAVKGFTSPSQSTSAIRLNWTRNANADGYVIEQFNGSAWVQIADITDKATTTYKVTGLKSGTAYKFRMKAYSVTKYGDTIYGDKTETLTANTQASAVTGLALKSRSAS